MSQHNSPPFHQGASSNPPGYQGYPPPGYQGYPPPGHQGLPPPGYQAPFYPTGPRPPLTSRQKSGARLAGILGFLLLSLGGTMIIVPILVLAFGALFVFVFDALRSSSASVDPDLTSLLGFVDGLNLQWLIPVLVIVAVLGVVLVVAAMFLSARILRGHGIAKAWGVTWAGAAIATVANWTVTNILSVPFSFLPLDLDADLGGVGSIAIVVFGFLVGVVAIAVVGWLSWWWMAHVMRDAATTDRAAF